MRKYGQQKHLIVTNLEHYGIKLTGNIELEPFSCHARGKQNNGLMVFFVDEIQKCSIILFHRLSIAIKASTIIFDLNLDASNDLFWIAIVRNSFFGTVDFVSNYNDIRVRGSDDADAKRALSM